MGILLQAQTTTTTEQDNFMDMLSNMGIGGNIVMAVLLLLSILAIYILVERYFAIRKESLEDEDFLMSIRKFVEEKNIDQAKKHWINKGKEHIVRDDLVEEINQLFIRAQKQ